MELLSKTVRMIWNVGINKVCCNHITLIILFLYCIITTITTVYYNKRNHNRWYIIHHVRGLCNQFNHAENTLLIP